MLNADNNILFGTQIERWLNDKKEILNTKSLFTNYANKDVRRMICDDYMNINNQINVDPSVNPKVYSKLWDKSKDPLHDVVLIKNTNKLMRYDIKLIDSSLNCRNLYYRTGTLLSNSINTEYIDNKSSYCSLQTHQYNNSSSSFFNDMNILLLKISALLGTKQIDSRNINKDKGTLNLVLLYNRLHNGSVMVFDNKKKRIHLRSREEIHKLFSSDMLLKALVKVSFVERGREMYSDVCYFSPEVQQIHIIGKMGPNFFKKNEFVGTKYEYLLLKKDINVEKAERKLIKSDMPNIKACHSDIIELVSMCNTKEIVETYDTDAYIQTCVLKLPFDVRSFDGFDGSDNYTLHVAFDDLSDSHQSKMYKDVLQFENFLKEKIGKTFSSIIKQKGKYDPYIKIGRFSENGTLWVDDEMKEYTFEECKKYLKRGTPVRAIFCYENTIRIYNSDYNSEDNGKISYVFPVLKQLQFFRPFNMDEYTLDSEDSEGW